MPLTPVSVKDYITLRENVNGEALRVPEYASGAFIPEDDKPWAYYTGVDANDVVAATGIQGGVATMKFSGGSFNVFVLQSPQGCRIRSLLDGVFYHNIDTYSPTTQWETITNIIYPGLNVDAIVMGLNHQIDFINYGPAPGNTSGFGWFAIGSPYVDGNILRNEALMAYDTLVFRIADDESNSPNSSLPIYVPTGKTLTELQTYVTAIAPEIDALTDGQIVEVTVTVALTLPGGIKTEPTAGALNERGGLITFTTTGPHADSIRIPAMNRTIMDGDSFSLTDTDVAALITRVTTSTTAATIRPRTSQDYQFSSARKAAKSFRK